MHSILRDLSVNIENNIYDESLPSIVLIRALSRLLTSYNTTKYRFYCYHVHFLKLNASETCLTIYMLLHCNYELNHLHKHGCNQKQF